MSNFNNFTNRVKKDLKYNMKQMKKHRIHYLFLLPYILIFITFTVLPVVVSIYLSFTNFNVLETPKFIGLQNYFKLFLNDSIFIKAIANTLMFALVTGPIGYLIALLMGWIINELARKQRVFMTVILYAPSLVGGMAAIWSIIFSSDAQGLLNSWLLRFGLISSPILFLKDTDYIIPIIIIVVLWGSLGTQFLSFIAGFQGIDRQYYEAGAIDGIKNRWQELWFITLPLMKPQLLFGAVISIAGSFGIGDAVTNLTGYPSKDYVAQTIMNHLQDYGGIRYEMGYSSAIATILFLIMIISNQLVHKLLNRVGD